MAQIRDYIRNQNEVQTLVPIEPNNGSFGFLQLEESVYKNGFSDLLLFADVGGVTALVLNTDYELSPADSDWTADEVGFSNKTVYPQFKITNATYQNVTVWATFTNFGVYTSADANFDMLGGSETVTTSATLVVPFGHTRYRFNFDSTSGDIAPTMPNGAFDGQQVILNEIGGGNVAYVTGAIVTALASGNENYIWNATDSEWIFSGGSNIVRAEYNGTASATSLTPIKAQTPIEDTHNAYDTATGKFTAPIDGVCNCEGAVVVPAGNGVVRELLLYKNGAQIKGVQSFSGATPAYAGIGKTSVRIAKGDTLSFRPNGYTSAATAGPWNAVFEMVPSY